MLVWYVITHDIYYKQKWKGIVILKKVEGNSNQNGRKYKFLKLIEKWKEIAISKLLFPSTPYFLRDLKVEGNSNENGRK